MIGHSLGAHLCGYAGYHLQRDFDLKIARITAMDPAEPFFAVSLIFFNAYNSIKLKIFSEHR